MRAPGRRRTAADAAAGRTPRRLAVVGASATGKTTFATRYAERRGLRLVELDRLRWDAGGAACGDAELARRLAAATGGAEPGAGWVVEGVDHAAPVVALWRHAEVVVWFDHNRAGVPLRMLVDNAPWTLLVPRGWPRARYLARKSARSWAQATVLRRALPPLLADLSSAGVPVVRLRSVPATRRFAARVLR